MNLWHRALRAGCALAIAASSFGCTSLREIPRSEYTELPEREDVRLVTNAGLEYEFDYARFGPDSLIGFRRQNIEGLVDHYATLRLPYSEVRSLAMRRVDWYRTGLVGGGVLAAVVVAGLSTSGRNDGSGGGSGGGGGRPPGIP